MNQSIISALAVVFGSLVGGAFTIATAWFIQRDPGQRESVSAEIRRRKLMYTGSSMNAPGWRWMPSVTSSRILEH